ncbi:MAG: hypothetical protein RMK34_03220 [Tepidimonas sp.]|uniref:hypothetical protein n=1 Tax=Tepidimonas sp. TaxID=2002775 RepID=UPI00298F0D58|nr:hypothetical protein [Tepidimonas sp.]MDW8335961.1 hypothetical protein [Tepidimonas sp.]
MRRARIDRFARRPAAVLAVLLLGGPLAGCDMLGIDTPAKQAERREAEGRAIGAACRHTQRSLEDCYAAHPKASKAAIFAGWREMDQYMRENDIPPATPSPRPSAPEPREEGVEPAPATSQANPKQAASPATAAPAAATTKPGAAPNAAASSAGPPTPPSGSIVPNLAPAAERAPKR